MVLERNSTKATNVGYLLDHWFPTLPEAHSRLIPVIYSHTLFEIYLSN